MNTIQTLIKEFEAIGYTLSYSNRLFDHTMKKDDRIVMFKFINDELYYLLFDNDYNVSFHGLNVYLCSKNSSYDESRFGSGYEAEADIIYKYCMCHLGNHITRGEL